MKSKANCIIRRLYEGQEIRIVDLNGDPWFVRNDVCAILKHSNPAAAVAGLDADEVSGVSIADPHGRVQLTAIVNFPGLLKLISNSRLPAAKAFDRWVRWEIVTPVLRGRVAELPPITERKSLRLWLAEIRKGHKCGFTGYDEARLAYRAALEQHGQISSINPPRDGMTGGPQQVLHLVPVAENDDGESSEGEDDGAA